MKKIVLILVVFFTLSSFGLKAPNRYIVNRIDNPNLPISNIESKYYALKSIKNNLPNMDSFNKAIEGYYKLKEKGKIKNEYLTIIDFSMASNSKRMWVIDMKNNKVVYNTLVAHGMNSGELYAKSFSNDNDSHKSSLGFYTTGETYIGEHGLSLKLDGLEYGINNNARKRAIVIHGADYVSSNFLKSHQKLGRSHGCPALPKELNDKIVKKIKNKSVLFVYYPNKTYFKYSKLIS